MDRDGSVHWLSPVGPQARGDATRQAASTAGTEVDPETRSDASPRGWSDAALASLPAKARRLVELAAAGLPVPPGLIVAADPTALDDAPTRAAIETLLREGPVVVRSALHGEDEVEGSAAGLGRSTLGCHELTAVRDALHALAEQRDDPWLAAYRGRGGPDRDRAILQREVPRRALLVVAVSPEGAIEVEVHEAGGEALAEGRTPEHAGTLARWDDRARAAVQRVVERASAVLEPTEHGHDLEIVVDPDDRPHLVQARPLAAPLHPGWPAFRQTLEAEGLLDALHGTLTLDAEHNPAPLSVAHAWLMDWLRSQRPKAGDPTVLAGWLYVRTLPRDLARRRSSRPEGEAPPPTAVEVLTRLRDEILPQARARLQQIEQRLATPPGAAAIIDVLPEAQQAFLAMIDAYVGVLIPARTRARRALAAAAAAQGDPMRAPASDPTRPLSTLGRHAFLDVLPATWDLASPSLADLGATTDAASVEIPRDEARAATLLGEWDDHLFALGLAPLRAWFRAAGARLDLGDDVFHLTAPEAVQALEALDTGSSPASLAERIATRRAAAIRHASLRPPLRIEDGQPVSHGRRARLRGVPLGPSFAGRLAPRRDLAELLARPPGPDAIVTIPSLTAPAAVALQQLGVRAVCCEHGGPLSHAALMARELGLSALVGCRGCTELPEDHRARIDTTAGRLVLEPSALDGSA